MRERKYPAWSNTAKQQEDEVRMPETQIRQKDNAPQPYNMQQADTLPQEFATHLTAAEVGALWVQYTNNTLADCMFQYYLAKDEDREIRQVVSFAQQVTRMQLRRIQAILKSDNYPLPIGFTDSDVNPEAPRLYSDPFFLAYIRSLAGLGLLNYGMSTILSSREDARQHFQQSIAETVELEDLVVKTEKKKGLYVRGPYIPAAARPEFVEKSDFLGGIFGPKRPLSAIEIGNIFAGAQNNIMGKPLLMGFAQTAEDKELREFFLRGKEIAHKHIEVLSALLINNDLPAPMSLDSYVTGSTVAPFSDKLMLQHTMLIVQAGLTYYGLALGSTARSDISGSYVRLMTEVSEYLEDAAQLMIKHKWMEQPPLAVDRRELALQ
ncbi:MAG: DUF3231 family protein [Negativicutes bacterium]|nr:DUF3231 family protein [Negativicutes bacterium]